MEYGHMKLNIPQKVQDSMEEKLILEDNIKEVIFHAEITGQKAINTKNNHIIAYHKPKIITYWVEYSIVKSPEVVRECCCNHREYDVHKVYCHRIEILS